MTTYKSIGFLLALAALVAAAFWMLPRVPLPAPVSVDDATASAPSAHPASAPKDAARQTRTAVARAPATGTVAGRVLDDEGRPLATAMVRVIESTPEGKQRVEAAVARGGDPRVEVLALAAPGPVAADGSFRFAAPGANPLSVVATCDGHLDAWQELDPIGARHIDVGTLTLARGIGVHGRVIDPDGRGVSGARVRSRLIDKGRKRGLIDLEAMIDLRFLDTGQAATDQDGRFDLLLNQPGTYQLAATHAAHPPASTEIAARARGERIDHVEIRMPPAGTIAGRVDGAPAGAVLRVIAAPKPKRGHPALREMLAAFDAGPGTAARTADVGADHRFAVRGLGQDTEHLLTLMEAQRGKEAEEPTFRACAEPMAVAAPAEGVVLEYQAPLVVTLRVVDAATQLAMPRVQIDAAFTRKSVVLFGLESTQSTSACRGEVAAEDGLVTLRLRPGPKDEKLVLRILAKGFATHDHAPVDIEDETRVDLGVVSLAPAPIVRVRVLAAGTRAPIPGATVELVAQEVPASADRGAVDRDFDNPFIAFPGDEAAGLERLELLKTGADGGCEVTVRRIAGAELRAMAPGHASGRLPLVALPHARVLEREIVLAAGGTVVVAVRDAHGRPVGRAHVERRCGADVASAVAGPDGRATFAHLAPGTHRFRVADHESGPEAMLLLDPPEATLHAVTIAGDETKEIVLVQPAKAAVYGAVSRRAQPLGGVAVALTPAGDDAAGRVVHDLAGQIGATLFGSRPDRTDEHGRYRLEGIAVGEYRLTVTVPDQAVPTSVPVMVAEGGTRCDVAVTCGSLGGVVVDEAGNGIARARVAIAGATGGPASVADALAGVLGTKATVDVTTDEQGRFQFETVPAGMPLVLTAQTETHYAAQSTVTVPADQGESGIRIVLRPGGGLRVRTAGESQSEGSTLVVAERVGGGAERELRMAARACARSQRSSRGVGRSASARMAHARAPEH